MTDQLQEVSTTKDVKGTVTFAPGSPSPIWATWTFRIIFLANKAATVLIAAEDMFTDKMKIKIFLYMSAVDLFVWGIAKGLGVKKKDFEDVN